MMAVDPGASNSLTWMPVAGAVSYTMQLAQDNSFTVLTAQQTTTSTTLPMPAIQYEGHYFWRVRAFDGSVNSAWSFECEFFTGIGLPFGVVFAYAVTTFEVVGALALFARRAVVPAAVALPGVFGAIVDRLAR